MLPYLLLKEIYSNFLLIYFLNVKNKYDQLAKFGYIFFFNKKNLKIFIERNLKELRKETDIPGATSYLLTSTKTEGLILHGSIIKDFILVFKLHKTIEHRRKNKV